MTVRHQMKNKKPYSSPVMVGAGININLTGYGEMPPGVQIRRHLEL